jgi:uncharacterized membrane protein (DUF2068 family)
VNLRPEPASALRAVALFEATKGVLVLVVGFGLLSAAHHDVQRLAAEIVRRFHLNLARFHPHILIDAANDFDNVHLRWLAMAALAYAAARLVEAYGLWRERRWAEWFAVISGGMFLPVELYELVHRVTAVRAGVVFVNVSIVAYLIYLFRYESRHRRTSSQLQR